MERLTAKRDDGRWALANNDRARPMEQMDKIPLAIDRLAAYEDSGLTPQEIEIQQIALSQCKPYIDAICDKRGTVLINPIRLAELAQAEKDGRLVVLPCKVGQDVFFLDEGFRNEICPATVFGIEINGNTPQCPMCLRIEYASPVIGKHEYFFRLDMMLGKTVFLTREEAEAALKKREET